MHIEVQSASNFFVHLIRLGRYGSRFAEDMLEALRQAIYVAIKQHYHGHWFPNKPMRGSGYRCIRINNGKLDPLLVIACDACTTVPKDLVSLSFPAELTLWIDPAEVSYRIGDNGSVCVLYTHNQLTPGQASNMALLDDIDGGTFVLEDHAPASPTPWVPNADFSVSPFRDRSAYHEGGYTSTHLPSNRLEPPSPKSIGGSSDDGLNGVCRQRSSDSTGNSLSTSPGSVTSEMSGACNQSDYSSVSSSTASSASGSPVPPFTGNCVADNMVMSENGRRAVRTLNLSPSTSEVSAPAISTRPAAVDLLQKLHDATAAAESRLQVQTPQQQTREPISAFV